MALIYHVILAILMFLPQLEGKGNQACSGSCNCSVQAPTVLTAWCRLRNLSELSRFIKRPQDVKVLHLEISKTQGWHEYLGGVNMSSLKQLQILTIVGNITWAIPEEILALSMLKEIKVAGTSKECSNCSLVKDYNVDSFTTSFVPEQGYTLRNICVEQAITLRQEYRVFPKNRFFPQCIMDDEVCRIKFGTLRTRNRCLDLGAPTLMASIIIAGLAIPANILVIILIATTQELRKKPSMMLVGSLAISDILIATYSLALGIVYQVITEEHFQSQLDHACAYLSFILVAGFSLTATVSFLITLERYLLIVHSFKPNWHMRKKATSRCICVAVITTLVPAFWVALEPELHTGTQICLPLYRHHTEGVIVFEVVAVSKYTLFYMASLGLYRKIYVTAKKSGKRMGIHREEKLLKSIGLIVGTNFVLVFAPLALTAITSPFVDQYLNNDMWTLLIYLPHSLPVLNTLIDPFLYAYRNPQFQQVMKQKWDRINTSRKTEESPTKDCENTKAAAVVILKIRRLSLS